MAGLKPLLIASRLPEDNNVWLFNERRSDALHSALWSQSHAADRRDAELMLQIAMSRHLGLDCEDGDERFSLSAWVLDMAVEA